MTPTIVTGYIRSLLKQQFGSGQLNFLTGLLADDSERRSEEVGAAIQIESLYAWDQGQSSEHRPALIIKPNPWEYVRVGIGDSAGGEALTGKFDYYGQIRGTHTIFALAATAQEAAGWGVELFYQLLFASKLIQQDLRLHKFVPVTIDDVGTIQDSTETYVCPVSVAYVLPVEWTVQIESPILKRIVLTNDEISLGIR